MSIVQSFGMGKSRAIDELSKKHLVIPLCLVIVRGLENPGGLSKGRWRVRVRVHILYPFCTLTLKEGKEGYTNTLEILKG